MKIEDKRTLQLIDYAVEKNVFETEVLFLEKARIPRTAIYAIRKAKQSFTAEQIRNVCLLTNGNMNWVFNIEPNMFLEKTKKPKTGLQLLREAQTVLESELAKKKPAVRPEILN